jgi:hypothetical protein
MGENISDKDIKIKTARKSSTGPGLLLRGGGRKIKV